MSREQDRERTAESRRILDRVSGEAEAGSLMSRVSAGLRDHVAGRDGEAEDRIDRLGSRIGRTLGLILTGALFIWLIAFLIRGG